MAEKGNLSNSRLKRAIDNRWCESYITRGGVSVMGAPWSACGRFSGAVTGRFQTRKIGGLSSRVGHELEEDDPWRVRSQPGVPMGW
jgi:hypothetical protein